MRQVYNHREPEKVARLMTKAEIEYLEMRVYMARVNLKYALLVGLLIGAVCGFILALIAV